MEYRIRKHIQRNYNDPEVKSEGLYYIEKLKKICNNDIRNFILNVKNSKNKVSDVEDTIKLLKKYFTNIQLTQEEKLLIFYYTYKYHKDILNYSVKDDARNLVLLDIDFLKPNYYKGYIDEKRYYFKIIFPEDEKGIKIFNFYNICEIKEITKPLVFINFKINKLNVVLIEENREINEKDEKSLIFLDIISILQQLNKHNIFINFTRENICFIDHKPQKFYLKDIHDYQVINILNFKKQIGILLRSINFTFPLTKYSNRIDIYDRIIRDLITK